MLYIPQLDTILIQPPRTGSTSLRDAVLDHYKGSLSLYRHMERDGIPEKYRRARVICMIREPRERLFSLWKYMRSRKQDKHEDTQWVDEVNEDTNQSFSGWIIHGSHPFTSPNTHPNRPDYYLVNHLLPATRKSQWWWARPDLGPVELIKLERKDIIEKRLGIPELPLSNHTDFEDIQYISAEAVDHINRFHKWDLDQYWG